VHNIVRRDLGSTNPVVYCNEWDMSPKMRTVSLPGRAVHDFDAPLLARTVSLSGRAVHNCDASLRPLRKSSPSESPERDWSGTGPPTGPA
jgi:hypothetical protein